MALCMTHYKPLLADHAAAEALGRFANLIATAQVSERLCEAMACTSLVAAKSGTKGQGKPETNGGAGAVCDS